MKSAKTLFKINANIAVFKNKHFYFLAIKDVFNKNIVGSHLGYHCKARDLKVTVERAIQKLNPDLSELVLRSDNGPQMTSNQFYEYINDIGLEHEFLLVRTLNRYANALPLEVEALILSLKREYGSITIRALAKVSGEI